MATLFDLLEEHKNNVTTQPQLTLASKSIPR